MWLSGSITAHRFLRVKKNPSSTLFPVLPISAMAQECLLLPALSQHLSLVSWRQQVTKTHDLPKRQSSWDCQIQLQTGQADTRVQLWHKQPSGGVLGEKRVQWCLSSASKALNYNSSSIVKIGKNKSNPNLGSAPFNYHRISKQHVAGQGGKGCMAFSFLKSFFSWNCCSPNVSNISNVNSHYIPYTNYLNCLWKLFSRVPGKTFHLKR